jgi:hypothetical protein
MGVAEDLRPGPPPPVSFHLLLPVLSLDALEDGAEVLVRRLYLGNGRRRGCRRGDLRGRQLLGCRPLGQGRAQECLLSLRHLSLAELLHVVRDLRLANPLQRGREVQQQRAIGRITTAGAVSEFAAFRIGQPDKITSGPDGALWFTELVAGKIGRITTGGDGGSPIVTEFPLPSASWVPGETLEGIASGPVGALWFADSSPTLSPTYEKSPSLPS